MKQITILDVLTPEGYQKFLDKGVGAKLSGTSFRADEPANNLFWAMFRRTVEMRDEADAKEQEHADTVMAIANELAVAEEQLRKQGSYVQDLQHDALDQRARIRKLERTLIEQAMKITALEEALRHA